MGKQALHIAITSNLITCLTAGILKIIESHHKLLVAKTLITKKRQITLLSLIF